MKIRDELGNLGFDCEKENQKLCKWDTNITKMQAYRKKIYHKRQRVGYAALPRNYQINKENVNPNNLIIQTNQTDPDETRLIQMSKLNLDAM